MTLLHGLALSPTLLALAVLLLGLCVGSFLNVVIHRLPLMLERDWRRECRTLLSLETTPAQPAEAVPPLSLLRPASHCPSCRAPIRPWHNVPVVSWLVLRGRCAACRAPISMQYPLVEAATGLLSLACALRFGWGPTLGAALLLTWALVALSVIDLRTQLLPDTITLPLLWLGLLLSVSGVFVRPSASIIGAAAGYLSLWSIYHVFRWVTGKEGMGYGDFKLLAALGAWFGWKALPMIVLLSSVVGAVIGLGLILLRGHDRNVPLPFGPYLALAGWIVLIGGRDLGTAWLRLTLPG
jgi:leader peptidase (prepilin peptidase)/N-methyltransferase